MTSALQRASDELDTPSPAGTMLPDMGRVLIVHDWIASWAGAERVLEAILEIFPHADVVVGIIAPKLKNLNDVTRKARETWLASLPGARTNHRWFLPLEGAAFASLDTGRYDVIISSTHAFSKMVRRRSGAVHVCYCHSPPRYLWDLSATYRENARGLQRLALVSATGVLRTVDRWSAGAVDTFLANSKFIADRIRRCYQRHADVVYPPVRAKAIGSARLERGNFLLHVGRLVSYKRVDLAIAAAEQLGVRFIVAGDGPERGRLERLAGGHTEFVGEVSETDAAHLLSTCAAFVFCSEEDFGIAPVEANAHGAPVVGYGRGGLLETMVPGVTAELFHEPSVAAVSSAVRAALARDWSTDLLMANAQRFSLERFREQFATAVGRAVSESRASSPRAPLPSTHPAPATSARRNGPR
ncbi:MAG TPA: glycosyltransferase [Gemmatimonadaceae bacterium]|nr:glycosyltransferase [Gemmatimonadaceae bacterium]